MTQPEDNQIRKVLQQSFPPVNAELRRDLWPAVLQKLDARTRATSVPWYDWALMALTAAMLVLFPQILFVFAYHL